MKRFFDLSLLLLVPMFLIGIYSSDSTVTSVTENVPEISTQAMEIHALVSSHVGMSLEDVQKSLDSAVAAANAPCDLKCEPPNCCYSQGYLDRLIYSFGCCIGEEGNDCNPNYVCLDLNGDDCITGADLTILLGNWCV